MRNHKVEKAEKDFGDGRSLFHLKLMNFLRVMVYLCLSDPGKTNDRGGDGKCASLYNVWIMQKLR